MASIVTPEQTQTTTIRVLAIEGDIAPAARVRSVLTNTFERLRLTECETVDTALRELTAGKADCILLGATAEDPEALAALSRLRAAGIETPVIILATKTDRSSVDRALGAGAQDLLLKGQFDERLLGRCIEYAMERRWVEFELAHQALHDGLTGLPNRALFTDRLGSALAHLEPGRRLAVLLLDIDRFRVINDSLGHDLGDRLLLMVAERISAALTDGQRAARFGGDEFAVLCEALTDHAGAVAAAERIERAFATPLLLGEEAVFLRMSTGIVLAGTDTDTDAVLRDADAAMNRAKERGGGTHEVFERPLHQHAVQRLKIEHSLHTALLREELTLSYQPQFRLDDGELYGTEALVRWNHPAHGVVGPSEFIASAEETGLVVELGAWVLEQACRQALDWPVQMSVNIAARQCVQPGFVEQVDGVLARTGIDPGRICLELTETGPIRDDSVALRVLTDLKRRGVQLAVDDFGTGYSSLHALRCLPFDVVKIDRSFIESIHTSSRDSAMVAAVIDLAHALGLSVVAEGVEHQVQADLLTELGCDCAQGFHLAMPEPAVVLRARFEVLR